MNKINSWFFSEVCEGDIFKPQCYRLIIDNNNLWYVGPKIKRTMAKRDERYKTTIYTLFSFIYAGVVLLYDHIDKWCWNLETTYNYIVEFECITIDRIIFSSVSLTVSLSSKGLVPNKIEVFLW